MIWACLTPQGLGAIHVLEGRLNARGYETILHDRLVPVIQTHFPDKNFVFQQDNAPAHKAKSVSSDQFYNLRYDPFYWKHGAQVQTWFDASGYSVLDWPPNSPDLSIIENVWNDLKEAVRKLQPSGKRNDLEEAIKKSWETCITSDRVQRLYESMPRRIQECLNNKGGHTSY